MTCNSMDKAGNARRIVLIASYHALVFVILYVFFAVIHPLVIYDTDDWTYVSFTRQAFPLLKTWNPTRVFPEVLMPLCGSIAAYVVYPLTGDYVRSFTPVFAAVGSLFVTGYVFLFGKVLREKYRQSLFKSILCSALFLSLHFVVIRCARRDNYYMFQANDTTCFFYYTIPAVLNCSMILFFMLEDVLENGWEKLRAGVYARRPVRYGMVLLAIYMALLSNLFTSIILVAYIGCQLVGETVRLLCKRTRLKEYVRKNSFRGGVIFLWGVVQVIELQGGRANSFGGDIFSKLSRVPEALNILAGVCGKFNKSFLCLTVASVLTALFLFFAKRRKGQKRSIWDGGKTVVFLQLTGTFVVIGAYMILLGAVTNPNAYLGRPETLFGMMFCLFMEIALCGVSILDDLSETAVLLPLLLCFVLCSINARRTPGFGQTFRETTVGNTDSAIAIRVGEDIVRQFKDAEKRGDDQLVLYVPRFEREDNWPIAYVWGGSRIAETLYKHGVVGWEITVTETIPSEDKNLAMYPRSHE